MASTTINPQQDIYGVLNIVSDELDKYRNSRVDRRINIINNTILQQLINQVIQTDGPHWNEDDECIEVERSVIEQIAQAKVAELFHGQWKVQFSEELRKGFYVITGTFPDVATALRVGIARKNMKFSEIRDLDGQDIPVPSGAPSYIEVFRKNEDGTDFRRYTITV